MNTTWQNVWYANNVKITDTYIINGLTISITQQVEPYKDIEVKKECECDDDEVTHGVFFGENIRRVIKAFKSKKQ